MEILAKTPQESYGQGYGASSDFVEMQRIKRKKCGVKVRCSTAELKCPRWLKLYPLQVSVFKATTQCCLFMEWGNIIRQFEIVICVESQWSIVVTRFVWLNSCTRVWVQHGGDSIYVGVTRPNALVHLNQQLCICIADPMSERRCDDIIQVQ